MLRLEDDPVVGPSIAIEAGSCKASSFPIKLNAWKAEVSLCGPGDGSCGGRIGLKFCAPAEQVDS